MTPRAAWATGNGGKTGVEMYTQAASLWAKSGDFSPLVPVPSACAKSALFVGRILFVVAGQRSAIDPPFEIPFG